MWLLDKWTWAWERRFAARIYAGTLRLWCGKRKWIASALQGLLGMEFLIWQAWKTELNLVNIYVSGNQLINLWLSPLQVDQITCWDYMERAIPQQTFPITRAAQIADLSHNNWSFLFMQFGLFRWKVLSWERCADTTSWMEHVKPIIPQSCWHECKSPRKG